jgi:predicted TIM-barrel fold metal-dependent hydrolase
LIDALHSVVEACPRTIFVGAHVGGHAEDLRSVGRALARLPNFHVDTGGRLGELGRQPRAFRRLVEAFPERVLFGSDCFPPDVATLRLWWRFFETDDEHFGYVPGDAAPPQGRWRISAANLPRTLLPPLYRENAERVLGL